MNMDNQSSNPVRTRNLPFQELMLPYHDATPTETFSGRCMLPPDIMVADNDGLTAEQVPLRLVHVADLLWSDADAEHFQLFEVAVNYPYLTSIMERHIPSQLLDYNLGFTFNLIYQFEFRQNIMYQGWLAIYWIPGADFEAIQLPVMQDENPTRKLFYYNPFLVSPQHRDTLEFTVPIVLHTNCMFSKNDIGALFYQFGKVVVEVVTPLRSAQEEVSLPIKVSTRLTNFKPVQIAG